MRGLEFGIVGVNDMVPATAEAPFGGMKTSGFGREGSGKKACMSIWIRSLCRSRSTAERAIQVAPLLSHDTRLRRYRSRRRSRPWIAELVGRRAILRIGVVDCWTFNMQRMVMRIARSNS